MIIDTSAYLTTLEFKGRNLPLLCVATIRSRKRTA